MNTAVSEKKKKGRTSVTDNLTCKRFILKLNVASPEMYKTKLR